MEDGKIQLNYVENFQEILTKLILRKIEKATLAGFERMNLALKKKLKNKTRRADRAVLSNTFITPR